MQSKYNSINISTRFLLHDFYEFLKSRRYVVGKLWPQGVSVGTYETAEERFSGRNYLAIRGDLSGLRDMLRCASVPFR